MKFFKNQITIQVYNSLFFAALLQDLINTQAHITSLNSTSTYLFKFSHTRFIYIHPFSIVNFSIIFPHLVPLLVQIIYTTHATIYIYSHSIISITVQPHSIIIPQWQRSLLVVPRFELHCSEDAQQWLPVPLREIVPSRRHKH